MLQASRGGRKKVMSKENGPKLSGSHSCMFHKEILKKVTEKKDLEVVFISSQAMDFVFRESIGKFF